MRKLVITLLALLILGYVAICAFLWWNQERMLFFPTFAAAAEMDALARQEGFAPWRNALRGQIGWQSIHNDADADALLICHGNGGFALGQHYALLREGAATHFQIHLLEYPGYGARPGKPSAKSLTAAAVEAIDTLTAENPHRRIWLMGQSLGTGVACAAAAARPDRIAGIVLVTPFDSLASAARTHYPWLPIDWLLRHRLDSDRNLTHYHGPVAFLIAGHDTTIPPQHAQRLYESYAGPKREWLSPEAGHNDLGQLLSDWADIATWLTAPR
jgi:pimeloyl-ACP methyl ester carboxylesterase